MRRNYISPEFEYKKVNGTLNMIEQSSFLGSKMLEIEDFIEIKNENIIYYQTENGEQLDLSSEISLPQIIYDTVLDKKENQNLKIDESQSNSDLENNTRWILDINIRKILKNYIFATMKKFRTFEGVQNSYTINNNVDSSIFDYIDKNVLSRYKLTRLEMFIKNVDLLTEGELKYVNKYDVNIESDEYILKKFETNTDFEDKEIRVLFSQSKSGNSFNFRYYYNLYFEKL